MANKEILEQKLSAIGDALDKIGGETSGLVTQVAELKTELENAGVDQALIDKADALLTKAQGIDALVPDPQVAQPDSPVTGTEGEQPAG